MLLSRAEGVSLRVLLATPAAPAWAMALGFWALLVTAVAAGMLALPHGAIGYTLDDPYIHLALAERIALGHYGINLGEVTAPSSSIIWPFLLLPGVGTPWHVWLPLGIGLACGAATAALIGRLVDQLPWAPTQGWARIALTLLLVLAGNLAGLPFTGMEHSLQVLIAAACAWGIAEAMRGRPIPLWCLAAAALGPAVRYEMFALVGALMVALAGQRRFGAATGLLAAALVLPLGFGAWLVSQGLPPLPNSVLAKSDVYAGAQGLLGPAFTLVSNAAVELLRHPRRWPYLALVLLLAALTLRAPPVQRWPLTGAVAALALHALVGRFGWMYRYEIYAVLFGTLVLAMALATAPRRWRTAGVAVLLATAAAQAPAVLQSPRAAQNIQDQQYQMHRFVADYWRQDIAVNDLGWVSYRGDPNRYVLDLYGLASNEALRQKDKHGSWLETIVRRHGIRLAMIYSWWFEDVPESWIRVAELRLSGKRIVVGGDTVTFYATEPGAEAEIRQKLAEFTPTLPKGVRLDLR
jgi:hypothetical protein